MLPEPLSPAAAVFLLVDHQTGVFERVVKAPPRDAVELNVRRLARAAAILDVPLIFTTSEEDGQNGALLPSLEEILPAAYAGRIDRHGTIDSLADPAVAMAVSATRPASADHGGDRHRGLRSCPSAARQPRRLPGDFRCRCVRLGDRARPRHLSSADGARGHNVDHHRLGRRRAHWRLPLVFPDHARLSQIRAIRTALLEADTADQATGQGFVRPLRGVPMTVKESCSAWPRSSRQAVDVSCAPRTSRPLSRMTTDRSTSARSQRRRATGRTPTSRSGSRTRPCPVSPPRSHRSAERPAALPIGAQIIGPLYEDDTALTFAALLGEVAGGYESPPLDAR
jgi:hypothetical protein